MIRYQLLGFFIAAVAIGYIIYRRHILDKSDKKRDSDGKNTQDKK